MIQKHMNTAKTQHVAILQNSKSGNNKITLIVFIIQFWYSSIKISKKIFFL